MRGWLWLPRELPAPPAELGTAQGWEQEQEQGLLLLTGIFPSQDLPSSSQARGSAAGFAGERVSPAGTEQCLEQVPTRSHPPAFKAEMRNHTGGS